KGEGYQAINGAALSWYYLNLNADPTNNPTLANEKVQPALKYAIDWEGLKKVCPSGSQRMPGLAPPELGGASESDPSAIHEDLAKAKSLLAEAGVPNGFKMTLTTFKFAGYCPLWEDLAVKLSADWKRIGVDAQVGVFDFDK